MRRRLLLSGAVAALACGWALAVAQEAADKPAAKPSRKERMVRQLQQQVKGAEAMIARLEKQLQTAADPAFKKATEDLLAAQKAYLENCRAMATALEGDNMDAYREAAKARGAIQRDLGRLREKQRLLADVQRLRNTIERVKDNPEALAQVEKAIQLITEVIELKDKLAAKVQEMGAAREAAMRATKGPRPRRERKGRREGPKPRKEAPAR